MKTLKELLELRAQALKNMGALVEERANNMDETALASIQSFKDDIAQLDLQIKAIEEVRSIAILNGKPVAEKQANVKSEFRSSFEQYLRGQIDNAEFEKRIMNKTTATEGLELVPDEFYKTLLDKVLEYGMLFSDANVITTANHGDLIIPTSDDTGNAGAWTAESGAITPADFVTGNTTMKAYKVATAIVVTTELLEDAFFDIETYIAQSLGVRLARTFESAFINGDGSGKPMGIIADPATVAKTSAVTLVVDEDDALELIYALTPSMRIGGVFYVSDTERKAMDAWKDTTGRPLLQVQASATQANGTLTTLYGYPVRINLELGDPTSTGDVPMIFGNPKNYWIRNIRNITVKRNDTLYSLTDEVLWTATTRLDGKPVSANPAFSKMTVKA